MVNVNVLVAEEKEYLLSFRVLHCIFVKGINQKLRFLMHKRDHCIMCISVQVTRSNLKQVVLGNCKRCLIYTTVASLLIINWLERSLCILHSNVFCQHDVLIVVSIKVVQSSLRIFLPHVGTVIHQISVFHRLHSVFSGRGRYHSRPDKESAA